MRKIKVQWTPTINNDIDAVTSKNSPFYDKELTNKILEQFGSIDDYKKLLNNNKRDE